MSTCVVPRAICCMFAMFVFANFWTNQPACTHYFSMIICWVLAIHSTLAPNFSAIYSLASFVAAEPPDFIPKHIRQHQDAHTINRPNSNPCRCNMTIKPLLFHHKLFLAYHFLPLAVNLFYYIFWLPSTSFYKEGGVAKMTHRLSDFHSTNAYIL